MSSSQSAYGRMGLVPRLLLPNKSRAAHGGKLLAACLYPMELRSDTELADNTTAV